MHTPRGCISTNEQAVVDISTASRRVWTSLDISLFGMNSALGLTDPAKACSNLSVCEDDFYEQVSDLLGVAQGQSTARSS